MIFEREGAAPIANPTTARVSSELQKLKSYGKSSFASLTRSDGVYVQVAGGGVGCMLEWRDPGADKHSRAFVEWPTVAFDDGTELVFGGGRIPLHRDEWLNIMVVVEVFTSFLHGEPFPPTVHWRDISDLVRLS